MGPVGGVAAHHEVDVQIGRNSCLKALEKAAGLDGAVTQLACADDPAGHDVQRGEQGAGAMARVVVAAARGLSRPHRQHGLAAVQRLDLAFLVHAQRRCAVGWRPMQAPPHREPWRQSPGRSTA